jgi:hypothetical protein
MFAQPRQPFTRNPTEGAKNMAKITLQIPGQPVADFSISGAVVTISGAAVDCAVAQDDTQVVVNIMRDKSGVTAINGKTGAYLAQIFIPAKQYHDQLSIDAEGRPVLDANGNQITNRVALPLDPNAVAVTLWPTV